MGSIISSFYNPPKYKHTIRSGSINHGHGLNHSEHIPKHKHVKKTLQEVIDEIKKAGLESSNLILAIDFTESNYDQGKKTNNGENLHQLHLDKLNQYQLVISALAETLIRFDEDGQIPIYGFGDLRTKNHSVFPMHDEKIGYVIGVEGALEAYNKTIDLFNKQVLKMSGPTSLVPIIEEAIKIVEDTCGYHILVIIGDGMVVDEEESEEAIVKASKYSLSIIFIGVGDGPWEKMEHFDTCLPKRSFDNFKFVNFSKYINSSSKKINAEFPAAQFASEALSEIPEQYIAIKEHKLLKRKKIIPSAPLAPPAPIYTQASQFLPVTPMYAPIAPGGPSIYYQETLYGEEYSGQIEGH
jgi:E3 ubiquitin-protein ligase RGLG